MSNVRLWKTFIAVATEGSFAGAAQRVALSQAAVGLQMRQLEDTLRRPLFERHGKSVALNQAGRELLGPARQWLALYDQMLASGGPDQPMAGVLQVGAVVSALRSVLQASLALKARHPGLDLHVRAAKSAELLARVQAGELDAAIAVNEGQTGALPALSWTPLYSEPMVLLVPAGAPERPVRQLVQQLPFIRFDPNEHTGQLVERTLRRMKLEPAPFLELNAIETVAELIRAGLGVAMLPLLRHQRWREDPHLRVVPLPARTEHRHIGLVQRRTTPRALAVGALLRAMQPAQEAPTIAP